MKTKYLKYKYSRPFNAVRKAYRDKKPLLKDFAFAAAVLVGAVAAGPVVTCCAIIGACGHYLLLTKEAESGMPVDTWYDKKIAGNWKNYSKSEKNFYRFYAKALVVGSLFCAVQPFAFNSVGVSPEVALAQAKDYAMPRHKVMANYSYKAKNNYFYWKWTDWMPSSGSVEVFVDATKNSKNNYYLTFAKSIDGCQPKIFDAGSYRMNGNGELERLNEKGLSL